MLLKRILKTLPLLLIFGIAYFVFQEEISIRYYQFMEERSFKPGGSSIVFETDVVPGYVEYVSEEGEDEIVFPQLSSVEAVLIYPGIKVRGKIVNGREDEAMNRGFWHYPSDSPFSELGNTVIIGHRYLYVPPKQNTFYNLNKARAGDKLRIESKYGTVNYVVKELRVVNRDELAILYTANRAQLTLVTCHPLWTSKQRLVVIAERTSADLIEME